MDQTSIAPHSLIFKEGTQADKLFIIKSGEVLCLKSSKDRLVPVFLAKVGDIIGESAIVGDSSYTYSTIAMKGTELIEVSSLQFKEVFASSPEWLNDLMSTMITRFQNTSNLIAENRIVHDSILGQDKFTPQMENEFKKILN